MGTVSIAGDPSLIESNLIESSRTFLYRIAAAAAAAASACVRVHQVFVMTQEWGPNYYHFTVEHLPRIMVFLDVLLEHKDIKVSSILPDGTALL